LSHIRFLAVGGVSASNAAEFMAAGCVGVGVGGNRTNKEWIAAGEWCKIAAAARELTDRISGKENSR
jgi:2-dehydro-3-deoxyphosphogluconate aldolase/(4S)-4-hydroxy-2-oxoglutarate aldolase